MGIPRSMEIAVKRILSPLLCAALLAACVGERSDDRPIDTSTTTREDTAEPRDTRIDTSTGTDTQPSEDTTEPTDSAQADTGSADVQPDVPPPTEIPFDELGAPLGDALCEIILNCTENTTLALFTQLMGTFEICQGVYGAFAVELLSHIGVLIEDGTIEYDAEAALDCIEYLESGACTTILLSFGESPLGACEGVFNGRVPPGEQCYRTEQCQGDTYCSYEVAGAGEVCPGVCVGRKALGADCNSTDECTRAGEKPVVCQRFQDVTGGSREVCLEIVEDNPPSTDSRCGAMPDVANGQLNLVDCPDNGTVCNAYDRIGECVTPTPAGQPCSSGDVCQSGTLCLYSDPSICGPMRVVNTAGESCEGSPLQGLKGCNTFAHLSCENNVCVRVGDGTLGSACDPGLFDFGICNVGLYCDDDSAACLRRKAAGERCTGDIECLSNTCLNNLCTEFNCGDL